MTRSDSPLWLREMVDDDIVGLFEDDRTNIARTVSKLLERVAYDEKLQNDMIDTLQTSLDLGNDDTSGTVWIALILGESSTTRAIPVLLHAIARDDDEEVQTAAGIAILKCGSPGVEALMESIEDAGPSPIFLRVTFELLGCTGYLRDEGLRRKVMVYLSDALEMALNDRESTIRIEGVARAAAWLGHRKILPLLKEVEQEHFRGQNPVLTDFIEMLQENTTGAPVVGELLPGEAEYAWAFEYHSDAFRPSRQDGAIEVDARAAGAQDEGFQNKAANEEPDGSKDDFKRYIQGQGLEGGSRRNGDDGSEPDS